MYVAKLKSTVLVKMHVCTARACSILCKYRYAAGLIPMHPIAAYCPCLRLSIDYKYQ